jgi:4-amino-4-deoxy-L-arabinose transferase-like glycosyltransferase
MEEKSRRPNFFQDHGPLLLILLLALSLRLLYLVSIDAYPKIEYVNNVRTDEFYFWERAKYILEGRQFDVLSTTYKFPPDPLYPNFLAAILKVAGKENLTAVRLVQIGLDCLSCLLVFLISRHYFTRAAGLISSLLYSLYGPFVVYASTLLRPTLVTFLLLVSVYCLIRIQRQPRRLPLYALLGLLEGLGCLLRSNFMVIGMASVFYLFYLYKKISLSRRIRMTSVAVFIGPLLLISS